MVEEARVQKNLRTSAESQAKAEAKENRGSEEWSDGKKNVRILTDYTGKERKQQQFVVEDVNSKKTFNIPKDKFFKSFNRIKDNFGDNIELTNELGDLNIKQCIIEYVESLDIDNKKEVISKTVHLYNQFS